MKIKLFLFAALAALTTLVGCSDNNGGGPGPVLPQGYEVTFGKATFSTQEVTITPKSAEAEESLYVYYFLTEEAFAEYGNSVETYVNAYLGYLIENNPDVSIKDIVWAMTEEGKIQGEQTYTVNGLKAESKYYVLVVGIDLEGNFTTESTATLFTSGSKPELVPVDCTFEWEVVRQGAIFLDVNVVPSDKTTPYVAFWLTPEEYQNMGGSPEGLKENLEAYMEALADANNFESVVDVMIQLQNKGEVTVQLQGLIPNSQYVLFLCGMDAYGRPTTDVQVLNSSTIAYVPSDAQMTAAARLYDGSTASSMSSTLFPPETYKGYYFVRVKPVLNDKAVAWYLLPTQSDYSKMPDEELLPTIFMQGNGPITDANIDVLASKSTEGTFYLYMYPVNENGEPGNIAKMSIDINKDNVWDIDTIFDEDYTQGEKASLTTHFSSAVEMMRDASAPVKAIRIRRM